MARGVDAMANSLRALEIAEFLSIIFTASIRFAWCSRSSSGLVLRPHSLLRCTSRLQTIRLARGIALCSEAMLNQLHEFQIAVNCHPSVYSLNLCKDFLAAG
mmetsp:Transcript_46667/g.74467  ORF Transcript_46667/g.74467 Transcript_46667/m.74467 type:complete len:102 (+) Transcript_46667:833-1138(+)